MSSWDVVDASADPGRLVAGLDRLRAEPFFRAIERRMTSLAAGDRVLDVGCGTGELGGSVGLDLSDMSSRKRRRAGRSRSARSPTTGSGKGASSPAGVDGRRGRPSPTAPKVSPPPLTFGQTSRIASRALPGVRYRRRLLWRYSLVWTKAW